MFPGAADAVPFFADLDAVPLCPSETVRAWGRTLMVAPHPDDESLGCGGALALLSRAGAAVHAVFVSDGTGSHPNSVKFPAPMLRDLREREALSALSLLGVPASQAAFLRLPDGAVPGLGAPGFAEAAARLGDLLTTLLPETVLTPWRRDPHPDHRAVSQIVQAALGTLPAPPRVLEYPVWAWERAAPGDIPEAREARAFRLDIREVVATKRSAVDAHQSQVTHLIDDDPHGFWLSPEVIAHFERPWEVYLEALSW